jgi:DNA-binding phage protein
MNQFQIEINVLRVRKELSMCDVAKSMGCNRKTLYRAFNCANVSLATATAMCEAVGSTIDEVNKLVKQQEELEK